MKPAALIQARTDSTRLPGKVLALLEGRPLLEYVIKRVRLSRNIGSVIVATSDRAQDDRIEELAKTLGAEVFRGSTLDVLDRFVKAAHEFEADTYVRVTADNPLLCPRLLDELIEDHQRKAVDYTCIKGFPLGLAESEVIRRTTLMRIYQETRPEEIFYREHVTTYVRTHPNLFRVNMRKAPESLQRPAFRLTVDEPADLELVRKICAHFGSRLDFDAGEITRYLDEHPDVAILNSHVRQRAG